ncbi:MAG: CidA/LrgA family protein [Methylibium sp.]|uniref:CidA/LrgA family protein n=1 Tax=Methylibium sp. TaxID=2067992 RepID=UPI001794578F|nr:CidA/LrgA family protein [Methylibium sp.]MBA3590693.1 CidA/LrgA family protein [Methylibium sp.]MBA3626108.1 CidA/LrgA family protein [Methylibium sp.]
MIQGLATLLLFQSLGEAIAQLTGAPVPGPVMGLVALLAVLLLRQRRGKPVWAALAQAADGLLAHLSIFFIPAAVGVMLYWEPLAREGLAWIVALLASTVAAIAVTAWFLRHRLGDEGGESPPDGPRPP